MRRGLTPSDLGDLFEQHLTAVLSIGLADGSVFSRPVWHRLMGGKFVFEFPAGDRKIAMLTTCWDYADEELMSPGVT